MIPGVGVIVNDILQDADQCWKDNQSFGFTPWHIHVIRKYVYHIHELNLESGLLKKLEEAWNIHSGMLLNLF